MVLVNKLAHTYDMGKKKTAEAVKNAVIEEVKTCQVSSICLASAFDSAHQSCQCESLLIQCLVLSWHDALDGVLMMGCG